METKQLINSLVMAYQSAVSNLSENLKKRLPRAPVDMKLVTRDTGIQFLVGFIIGKVIGVLVSCYSLISMYFVDPTLGSIVVEELVLSLFELNGYHLVLGVIGGLMVFTLFNDSLNDLG